MLRGALAVALLAAAACETRPQDSTLASTWQAAGSTVSLAAWAGDSTRLRAAIERARDSMQQSDPQRTRDALRRAWAGQRAGLSLQPDWRDVTDSYAVDQVAATLTGTVDSALFDLGGLFLWIGPSTRRLVGIADPRNALEPIAHVEWRGGAISTVSGRGEQRAVTVLASTAFQASAWASALFAVGCDRALALAPRGISLVCADSAGVRWSPELRNRVSLPVARAP